MAQCSMLCSLLTAQYSKLNAVDTVYGSKIGTLAYSNHDIPYFAEWRAVSIRVWSRVQNKARLRRRELRLGSDCKQSTARIYPTGLA